MKKNNIQKYLQNYAEKNISFETDRFWDDLLIIPAINEFDDLLETLSSLSLACEKKEILLILVVNACVDSRLEQIETNLRLISFLKEQGTIEKQAGNKFLLKYQNFHILLLDYSSEVNLFPEKSGVGLARKTGGDTALYLINNGNVKSEWLRYTDADVFIPEHFFNFNPNPDKFSALIYPFYHQNIYQNDHILKYEIYLRYYLLGLRFASSPYAFHTIGSTISVLADAYAMVRGFPKKREAAEDFYMLNKLAKISPFFYPKTKPLLIKGRQSERVPFGTGKAMLKIAELAKQNQDYFIYHPLVFSVLRDLLLYLEKVAEDRSLKEGFQTIDSAIAGRISDFFSLEQSLKDLLQLSKETAKIKRHISNWFDAFKTLKMINLITAEFIKPLPVIDALKEAPFIKINSSNKFEQIREELILLELDLQK